MAVINITAVVGNPPATLKDYDCIKFKRSMRGQQGPWIEVSTPATRPAIVTDKLVYQFPDPQGSASYWYCNSYYNSVTGMEGSNSTPIMGQGDAALNIVSVDSLKSNYLFGLDLTDPQGKPMPDSLFQFFIKSAVAWMEVNLDLPLRPKVVVDERHPFYAADARRYLHTQLNICPVQSIQAVRIVWPGMFAEQTTPLPPEWIRLDSDDGSFRVVPAGGYTSNFPTTGPADFAWAGLTSGGVYSYLNADFVPDVIRVDYLSGFPDGKVPQEIVEIISKVSAYGPLNIAGDLIGGAGIASQSCSLDGFSQSLNTTSSPMFSGYGARLSIYQKEVAEQIPVIRQYYHGAKMRVM